jgi:hypothetical protein
MLTNFLPNQGNGTFEIAAIGTDSSGNVVVLGSKTITCDNANAVKPFGAMDTPEQGGTASGTSYVNYGWALTPLPNAIPTDGSTINVWIDGTDFGHPVYNIYRADIAALFPGYANSDGAVGYIYIDTTQYSDGVHSIAWSVKDDAGNKDGIGSRYFTIYNNTNTGTKSSKTSRKNRSQKTVDNRFVEDPSPIMVKRGYNEDMKPREIYPDKGIVTIEIKELERVEIHLDGKPDEGYLVVNRQLRPLPIGSTFDPDKNIFYWQPGPGFIGNYRLVFIEDKEKKILNITISPKFGKRK